MNQEDKSIDILGIKPVAEALNTIVSGTVAGTGAILSRICLPVAEEFGYLLRDRVASWRSKNVLDTIAKTDEHLSKLPEHELLHAHPRITAQILDEASWVNEDHLQDAWAGLLASACTTDGTDESNLIFVRLLSQLTSSQVKLLQYACISCNKVITKGGLVVANQLYANAEEVSKITNVPDTHRLDRELDHLCSLGLLYPFGGFDGDNMIADITPSAIGLQLYARCQGSRDSPDKFFELESVEHLAN